MFRAWLPVSMLLASASLIACADDSQEPAAAREPGETLGLRAQNILLVSVKRAQSALSNEQKSRLKRIQGEAWAEEVHTAQLASNPTSILGAGCEIGIDVSPTEHYVVIIERRTVHESGNISWHGRLRDGSGEFRITIGGDIGYGELMVGSDQYVIEPIGNGLHAIVHTDPSGFGIEAEPITTTQGDIKPRNQFSWVN